MHFVLDARTAHNHFPGIGRYAFGLARALPPLLDRGERLTLLYDSTKPSSWDLGELARNDITVVDVPVSNFSARQQWQLPALLTRCKGDVYHSPYYLMPLRPGVPTVLTIHDLIPICRPQYFPRAKRVMFTMAVRLAARAADLILTLSRTSARDLERLLGVNSSQITITPVAADPIFVPQARETVENLRRRVGLPEQYILYAGSNRPHKNLGRLIEAWARLQPQPLPLAIAGVLDPRFKMAERKAEILRLGDAIRFIGPVPESDLPALYCGAELFVFPSAYEGFGLPVLEAMACGTPVACSEAGSLPEIAGGAAVLFDPSDVDAMANAIEGTLANPDLRAALSRQSVTRAAQFSWETTGRLTLAAYRRFAM